MVMAKDPAIKLFGRTISLPDTQFSDDSESLDNGSCMMTKTEADECRNESSAIMDEAVSQPQTSGPQGDHEESQGDGEPKPPFKRPDKILPCPRCNSSDTKFCYFNNYNVNQPRHFCKSCQRYWTAGGTVRNVPIGAGRRRNKNLASQYRQIIGSADGGPTTLPETPDSGNHQILSCDESSNSCTASSPNEMVLKFGPESAHYDSGLSPKQRNRCSEAGLYQCAVPPHVSPLSPSLNGGAVAPLAVPGYGASNISLQFVPAPYWNCIPVWVAGSGNISLALSNGCGSPPLLSNGSGLQVLGKRSRDTDTANEENAEKCISAPKTLRIHDLDES